MRREWDPTKLTMVVRRQGTQDILLRFSPPKGKDLCRACLTFIDDEVTKLRGLDLAMVESSGDDEHSSGSRKGV
jgi:hypothetical protein